MNELDYKKRIKQLEKYEKAHISMCQENERLRRMLECIVNSSKPVYRYNISMNKGNFPSSFNVGYSELTDAKNYFKRNKGATK